MLIAGVQDQIELLHQRGDPQIVGWDGFPLATELLENSRVVKGRLLIGI